MAVQFGESSYRHRLNFPLRTEWTNRYCSAARLDQVTDLSEECGWRN